MTREDWPGVEKGPNSVPKFGNESEFQSWLEYRFERKGYDVLTEVKPHNSRYRADMILINGKLSPIGMELKYFSGGSDAARAHQQIVRQYAGRKYVGRKVNRWVFAPYMPKLVNELNKSGYHGRWSKAETLEHFFVRYGIGYLRLHRKPQAEIVWGKDKYRTGAFALKRQVSDRINNHDITAIDQRISERLYND